MASDGANDNFGFSVSLDGTRALVGAFLEDARTTDSGSAYVFVLNGSVWSQEQKIFPNDGVFQDRFGVSVSLDGDRALIGAYTDDDRGTDSGSAYVFERVGSFWSQRAKLLAADGAFSDQFGRSVSLSGDRALVGAYLEDARSTDSGSAYVFVRSGTAWLQEEKLVPSDGAFRDRFGLSVSLDGDRALIGAYLDDDRGTDSGSVYVFGRSSSIWSQGLKLTASDGGPGDQFGFSVSLDGNNALIGSYLDDEGGGNAGAVYILQEGPPFELVTNEGLTLDEGASEIITSILLSAAGGPSGTDQMVFTLMAVPTNGTLKLNTTDLGASDAFTQDDVDNNLVSYAHDGSETTSDGFTFTLSDGRTTLPRASFQITVTPVNDPPVADAGPDQAGEDAVECSGIPTQVTLDGSGSSDLEDDDLTFSWEGPFGTVTGENPTVPLPLGSHAIELTVNDGEFTDTDQVAIEVVDTVPPVVVTQNITIDLDETGVASITAEQVDDGSSDVCGIASLAVSPSSFTCEDVGANEVTLTVTDEGGNSATGTATVTVQDVTPPVVVTKNITVDLDASGSVSINAADVNDGSSDACGISSLAVTPNSFDCTNVGDNTVTLTVTDVNGNSAEGIATVTVRDVTPPEVVTKNITVDLDEFGNASIIASDVDDGSSDACGIASLSVSPTTFDCNSVGENEVTLTVTDVNGNSAEGTAIVTLRDVTPPTVVTKNFTVDLDEFGNASIVAADVDDGSSDACGIADLSVSPNAFDCSNVGDNTVTLTATDNHGNISSATATVRVNDVTPPDIVTITGPQTLECTNPDGEEIALSVTATDLCDGELEYAWTDEFDAPLGNTPNITATFGLGNHTATVVVTDDSGNSVTGTVSIVVQDTTPPVITEVTLDPSVLWPPNHKYHTIAFSALVNDICDPSVALAWTVSSDEPDDANGNGDGKTTGDIRVTSGEVVILSSDDEEEREIAFETGDLLELRSEREGTGDGRIYTITLTATDGSGNISTSTAEVTVPHDQGDGKGKGKNLAKVAGVGGRDGLVGGFDPFSGSPEVRFGLDSNEPLSFRLYQNAPNPFNPSTTIRYALAEGSHVRLTIFNLVGQKVRVLVNARHGTGTYNVQWDGQDEVGQLVASGLYIYRLEAGAHTVVRKMLLTK